MPCIDSLCKEHQRKQRRNQSADVRGMAAESEKGYWIRGGQEADGERKEEQAADGGRREQRISMGQ